MAPLTPFITERVWQDLFASTSDDVAESVHLAAWPVVDDSLVDDGLARQVALTRRLVELGRATRAESGTKTRQPLAAALVDRTAYASLGDELRAELAAELNVLAIGELGDASGLVSTSAKGNFRALGRRFGKQTPVVAQAVADADAAELAQSLRSVGTATVLVAGEPVEVGVDDVIITETPLAGWAVATDSGETIALDLALTPELRRAGLARDVVRAIQEARKGSGLDVSDRIELEWTASGELAEALREHGAAVADEVLALAFTEGASGSETLVDTADGPAQTDVFRHRDAETGLEFWFVRTKR